MREYTASELPDPRNIDFQVWVGDRLWPRHEARVSVFDSSVQGGDAVWEGLRVYGGRIFALDAHLDRLCASAHALAFTGVPPRDEIKAARLTHSVAKTGNVTAQLKMGLMYARGRGVEKDSVQAAEWFRRAADQGNAVAQAKLAVMSAYGIGLPKDETEAARWFRAAAEQGHAGAQFNLGLMFAYGWGMEKHLDEAMQWYQKAAEQGHSGAQLNLRLMRLQARRNARGVWPSWAWLALAAFVVGTFTLWWYVH